MDKQIEIKRGEGVMVDLLNQEMNELQAHQKQIEEIVGDIAKGISGVFVDEIVYLANCLYNAGYRKIPENAVVLTREAYNKLEKKIADLSYDAHFHKQQEERIVDLQYDKFELKQEISEKDNKIKLLEETIECIKFNVNFTRKETAEKFAEMVSQVIVENTYPYFDKDGKPVNIWNAVLGFDKIDEIAKKIAEGKV